MTHDPKDRVFGLVWGDPEEKEEKAEVECRLRAAQTGVQIPTLLLTGCVI